MSRCLVLNMDYTFLGVCDWKDAVCAVYTNKVIVEESYDEVIRSSSTQMRVPAVIRLRKYVRVVYERISYISYTKRNVHLRDAYVCQYCSIRCKGDEATIDHIIPESKGGVDSWENTVTCCKPCNLLKDNLTLAQAGMKLIKAPTRPKKLREVVRIKLGELHDLWLKYLA
ncbi:MAG: HNH endonuclease [Candidatus Omnitrophica bacterium]|nr:HNH endonuclease [Candidatus Omnitrophota bacterium]MDE2213956.1 HNH endonuclease [Candidatus Omnitrophota bacterium]